MRGKLTCPTTHNLNEFHFLTIHKKSPLNFTKIHNNYGNQLEYGVNKGSKMILNNSKPSRLMLDDNI